MPQTATIQSLHIAFEMMKACKRKPGMGRRLSPALPRGVDHDLEDQMQNSLDQRLREMLSQEVVPRDAALLYDHWSLEEPALTR